MDWNTFYRNRINSTYQDYFEKRYFPFIEFILKQDEREIVETGCGIGSVTKALVKHDFKCTGFDIDPFLVSLANENLYSIFGKNVFYKQDMFNEENATEKLAISHGVLEHFDDDLILRSKELYPNSIHYVPLDKYEKPSFGDERLMPYEFWLDLLNPKQWMLFNDGHDLLFKM